MPKATDSTWQGREEHPGRAPSNSGSEPLLDAQCVWGSRCHKLEDYSSILNRIKARMGMGEGPKGPLAGAETASLPFVWGGPATTQIRRPRDGSVHKLQQGSTNCILTYTCLWRTKAILMKAGCWEGFLFAYSSCFLVVSVGNKRPFSKPLPFQICPGLSSGDSKPHLTSWSRQAPNPRTPRFSALQLSLHRWSASAWEVNSESVLSLPWLEKGDGSFNPGPLPFK